jgi:hypothetical protein
MGTIFDSLTSPTKAQVPALSDGLLLIFSFLPANYSSVSLLKNWDGLNEKKMFFFGSTGV